MIRADQIPLEVRNAISSARKNGASSAEIAAAMLKAWPGSVTGHRVDDGKPWVKLPLPQEPGAFDYWPANEEYNWGDND